MATPDIRPRQHAAEILALRTREERAARLDEVPEQWRELVKKHVEIQYELLKWRKYANRSN